LCDADEESSSDMLRKELDTDYDDEFNLEIEGETVSEFKHKILFEIYNPKDP
jgi:hypothetical protein